MGKIDGLVISTPKGDQVYTITGAEKPYRALIEDMREGAVMLSDDNTVLYCNNGFAKMLKAPMEKIVGVKIETMICPTYIKAFEELLFLGRTRKGAVMKEITLQGKDILVPTLMSINSLQSDTIKNTFLVVTDLSEHMDEEVKRYTRELELAQIALSESEQRWSTTLASIGDAVIATDLSGKITFMNSIAEKLTQWSLNDAFGKPIQVIFKILNEFTHKIVDNPVSKVLEKGMIVGLANHTFLFRKDGTEVAIDDSGAPIKDKEGKITGVVLIFRDITERRKAEKALEQQKAIAQQEKDRLSSLLNSITDEVWFADTTKKFTLANASATQEFKLDTSAQNVNVEDLAASLEVYRSDGSVRPMEEAPPLRALKGEVVKNQEEIIRTSASGELRYRQVSAAPVKDEKGNIIGSVSVARDISELKQLQNRLEKYNQDLEKTVEERTKQLQEKERLAAIGATAGMVGHDIPNPLQAIVGDLYLAKEEIKEIPNVECSRAMLETVGEIEKNVDYINKIVADLQDFARPLNPNIEEANLKGIIDDLLLKNGLPENVKVIVKVEVEACKFTVDSSFINRIMSNLVSNAVQAMPKGGTLDIHVFKEANDVVIKVKDTGVGIPDSVKAKLFTPMFTTKARGQGFGLVVIKRMTEALGGTVSFESEEGKGTTFEVRLPSQKIKS